MARVVTTIDIRRSIDEVFTYVSTPGNWAQWHPATLDVNGATDHSLMPGEQICEDFQVGGRRARALWTVQKRDAPRLWKIEGYTPQGGRATIAYRLTELADGTGFERELEYSKPGLVFMLLDWLFIRRRMQAQSKEALTRLKAALEARM